MAKDKIQITMDERLAKRVRDFADNNYLSVSTLLTTAAVQYLDQFEALRIIKGFGESLRKIADSGVCTPEQVKEMEDWGRAIDILLRKE